jgi:hypothetical protein
LKKIAAFVFIFLTISTIYAQTTDEEIGDIQDVLIVSKIHSENTDSSTIKPQDPPFPFGLYFEAIIPPFIKQIAPDKVPNMFIFAGGATYADFGVGVTFFHDLIKAQINYGFFTQEIYESLGGWGRLRYGGNVFGFKLLVSPEINFGKIYGSDYDNISISFSFGYNYSCFEITQSGSPEWMGAWLLQLELFKITFPDRNYLRSFCVFTEFQLWQVPMDVDALNMGISPLNPHLILGIRMYIF